MHERSETIEKDGKYVNVYGRGTSTPGDPLPKRYRFEHDSYDTVKDAVHAARKRSSAEGRRPGLVGHGYNSAEIRALHRED